MDCSLPGSFVHGDSPGNNTGVDFHALLQGIFPTQGSNPGLPHCRQILSCLSPPPHTYCIIHSSLRGHLGCVHIVAVVDNAPVNIGVHISSQISVFLSFGFVCISLSVVFDSLGPHGLWPARFSCLWYSPGKNTGVDCHSLLQRNFPTQGSNPCLLHHRQVLYRLSYREVLWINTQK